MTDVTPTADAATDVDALSYEQARDELVRVVTELEQGGATLEQSIALWERGEALARRPAAAQRVAPEVEVVAVGGARGQALARRGRRRLGGTAAHHADMVSGARGATPPCSARFRGGSHARRGPTRPPSTVLSVPSGCFSERYALAML